YEIIGVLAELVLQGTSGLTVLRCQGVTSSRGIIRVRSSLMKPVHGF
ncbi:MAG: hypothetical protein ACI8XC_003496, partial [Gammaproteobacteria bacterium]